MNEFAPAPDGQPTSNIETMLETAKANYYGWENRHHDLRESLDRAERMMTYWENEEQRLEWQIRQRKDKR